MKLVIPPECQVVNRHYSIRFSENMLRSADARAQSDHIMQVIRLSRKRPDVQKLEELIHEGLESIQDCLNLELPHNTIIALSPTLAQFLLSLGIEPDFSQIPEEE